MPVQFRFQADDVDLGYLEGEEFRQEKEAARCGSSVMIMGPSAVALWEGLHPQTRR